MSRMGCKVGFLDMGVEKESSEIHFKNFILQTAWPVILLHLTILGFLLYVEGDQ